MPDIDFKLVLMKLIAAICRYFIWKRVPS